jgi:hypothetical protein
MSAVVIARPKSFSREGGGLVEGDTGEDGDGLAVIWWRNNDWLQCAACNIDNGTYGLPVIGDTSRESVIMSSND